GVSRPSVPSARRLQPAVVDATVDVANRPLGARKPAFSFSIDARAHANRCTRTQPSSSASVDSPTGSGRRGPRQYAFAYMIIGLHAILFTDDPVATRSFL